MNGFCVGKSTMGGGGGAYSPRPPSLWVVAGTYLRKCEFSSLQSREGIVRLTMNKYSTNRSPETKKKHKSKVTMCEMLAGNPG